MERSRMFTFAVIATAVAATALIVGPVADARQGNAWAWEYAELIAVGEQVVVVREQGQVRLDPPSSRSGSRSSDNGRVVHELNVRLMHLNALGAEGWEVLSTFAVQDRVVYLLRRRR